MVVANSPDIFQHNIFEFIHVYIDELWILTKRWLTGHVKILELTLNDMKESELKCDIENLS